MSGPPPWSSRPLAAAQRSQRRNNPPRPVSDFILAQGAIDRLELEAQQDRIASRGDRAAAENLGWAEIPQRRDFRSGDRLLHLFERDSVVKDEREIAFDDGIFSERPEPDRAQAESV